MWDECSVTFVTDGEPFDLRAEKAPRTTVHPKHTVGIVPFPADSSVTHRDINIAPPVNFPVTTSGQTVFAHELRPVVKPVWVFYIRLPVGHEGHLPVMVRQLQVSVDGVCVQHKFAGI